MMPHLELLALLCSAVVVVSAVAFVVGAGLTRG